MVSLLYFCVICGFADDTTEYRASYGLYRDGFFDAAGRSFEDFIEKYPESPYFDKALYYLAVSELKQDKFQDAFRPLLKLYAIKDFPFHNQIVYYLALNYFQTGDYINAVAYIRKALVFVEDITQREKLSYFLVEALRENGDLEQAQSATLEYIKNDQFELHRVALLQQLVDRYMADQDFQNAIITMDLLITESGINSKDRAVLQYNYLYALYMTERTQDAVTFFERHSFTFDKDLYYLMADIYYKQNRKSDAYALFEEIYQNTKDADAVEKEAVILGENGDYKKALALLEERSGKSAYILFKGQLAGKIPDNVRGLEIMSRKKIADFTRDELLLYDHFVSSLDNTAGYCAIADVLAVTDRLTSNERNLLLYNTAAALYKTGDMERSIVVMRRWLAEFAGDPLYDRMLYMVGVSLKTASRYDEAIIEFSKLQKYNKKDRIFYESFVDKGECFFLQREYGQSIDAYKIYLANSISVERKQKTMLQLGNAYFNIKQYDRAYKTYVTFRDQYGNVDNVYVKIAETLLKKSDYPEAIKYFDKRDGVGAYPLFVYLYACYKTEQYDRVYTALDKLTAYKNDPSYGEMLYIVVLSLQKLDKYNELLALYQSNQSFIKAHDDGKIRRVLIKPLLKIGKDDLVVQLFDKPDDKTLFYMGESCADSGMRSRAGEIFNQLLDRQASLEYRELFVIYSFYMDENNYKRALLTVQRLENLFPDAVEVAVMHFELAYMTGNEEELTRLGMEQRIEKAPLLKQLITITENYLHDKNTDAYYNALMPLCNNGDIDKVTIRQIIKILLQISIETGTYQKGADVLSKIPTVKMNLLDAHTRFMEAQLYEKSGREDKAADLYLKIFYLYPSDVYWVHESIQAVIRLYRLRGEENRIGKITEMFEAKYFKL